MVGACEGMSKERETKHEKYNRHNRNSHIPGYTPSCRILICLLLWLSVLMPSLREFVVNVLTENNIQSDPDKIINEITKIARTRAVNNVAAISDDEVRDMVINNADLANRLATEEREKQKREEERIAEQQKQKEQEKLEKELEKERKLADGEQTTLF